MIRSNLTDGKGIVWIASYPKSGNTWVRVFLHHLRRVMAGLPVDADDLNNLRKSSLYELSLVPLYEKITEKPKEAFSLAEINKARPKVQAAIAAEQDEVALIKTHSVRTIVQGHQTINPDVTLGAVYLVRNPLDVAISLKDFYATKQDNAIGVLNARDFTANPHGVFEIWGSWSQNVGSWTGQPAADTIVVRYEDMMADPPASFAAIARHLKLDATAAQIAEALELSSFERMKASEARSGFAEKPIASQMLFREGRVGQWRDLLTAEQIKRIVKANHAEMKRHGYLTEDLAALAPVATPGG